MGFPRWRGDPVDRKTLTEPVRSVAGVEKSNRASLEFTLKWQSEKAWHNDRLFIGEVDFWRDIFPGDLGDHVAKLSPGGQIGVSFAAGKLVEPFDDKKIVRFKPEQFEREHGHRMIEPRAGRFYPRGFAPGPMNCHRGSFLPFRLLEVNGESMLGDMNHPLARYPLTLGVTYREKLIAIEEHVGVRYDIAEQVTQRGPGMQVVASSERPTDFYSDYPFDRRDDEDDAAFYREPRMIQHLDDTAIAQVTGLYARLLKPGMQVLDLMSSMLSHLPAVDGLQVTGLGMNMQELEANQRLDDRLVHDLNANPALPLADEQFDVVVCTSSIEYLVDPLAVIDDVARVLKRGGVFIATFSDRWFPGKEISLWSEMHPFERFGLVLDLFARSGRFRDLHTESIRGLPRPPHDRYIDVSPHSDPVFAVWGTRR